MTSIEVQEILGEAFFITEVEELFEDYNNKIDSVRTFGEAGILTVDDGIVLRLRDGSRVLLTIQTRND